MSKQKNSFNKVEHNVDSFDKNIDFTITEEEKEELDDEYNYPLTFKERIIEKKCKLKHKIKPRQIVYPIATLLLLSLTATTVYAGIKASHSKENVIVSNDPVKAENLFESATHENLIQKDLYNISNIDVLRYCTNWGSEQVTDIKFNKDLINKNILAVVEPSISQYLTMNHLTSINYALQDDKHLLAEVRWCKIENEKLVGRVYYDCLSISI